MLTDTSKILKAEAFAEEVRGLLYTVSASELHYSADCVKPALEKTFDLAARWKALILLDEDGAFLEKRSDNELYGNNSRPLPQTRRSMALALRTSRSLSLPKDI